MADPISAFIVAAIHVVEAFAAAYKASALVRAIVLIAATVAISALGRAVAGAGKRVNQGTELALKLDPTFPRQIVAGRASTGGSIVWSFTGTDHPNNKDRVNEFLVRVIALSDQPASLVKITSGEQTLTFGGTPRPATWDGITWVCDQYRTDGGDPAMHLLFISGYNPPEADVASQDARNWMIERAQYSGWDASMVGNGMCWALVIYGYNVTAFPAGEPQLVFHLVGSQEVVTVAPPPAPAVVTGRMVVNDGTMIGLTLPSTPVAGNMLVAACVVTGSLPGWPSVNTAAGWNIVSAATHDSHVLDPHTRVAWRLVPAGDSATQAPFTLGSSESVAVACWEVAGLDPSFIPSFLAVSIDTPWFGRGYVAPNDSGSQACIQLFLGAASPNVGDPGVGALTTTGGAAFTVTDSAHVIGGIGGTAAHRLSTSAPGFSTVTLDWGVGMPVGGILITLKPAVVLTGSDPAGTDVGSSAAYPIGNQNIAALITYLLKGVKPNGVLMIGADATSTDLPDTMITQAIAECDTLVPRLAPDPNTGATSEALYWGGMMLDASQSVADMLTDLCFAMDGSVYDRGGVINISPGIARTPIFDLTDEDIIWSEEQSWQPHADLSALYNVVSGSYVPESANMTQMSYPIQTNASYIVDDGGERIVLNRDYKAIHGDERIQRITKRVLLNSRNQAVVAFVGPLWLLEAEQGDWFNLTSNKWGFLSKTFMVQNIVLTVDLKVAIIAIETDPAIDTFDPTIDITQINVPTVIGGGGSGGTTGGGTTGSGGSTLSTVGLLDESGVVLLDEAGQPILDESSIPVVPTTTTGDSTSVPTPAAIDMDAGAFVNIYDASGTMAIRLADATDPTRFANGYLLSAVAAGGTPVVSYTGTNTSVSPTLAGPVWLSETTPGGYQMSPPSDTAYGHISQPIGTAIPGVGITFLPGQALPI